jgi:hypothetical protein
MDGRLHELHVCTLHAVAIIWHVRCKEGGLPAPWQSCRTFYVINSQLQVSFASVVSLPDGA